MPRDIPLSNGNMFINFDADYNIRDIYYPYVGQENHSQDCISRTGVWVEGQFAWLSDPAWRKTIRYEQDTLVTEVTAKNRKLGLTLTFHDIICYDRDIFLREVHIHNHSDHPREVRLFFHYDFRLMGKEHGGTAYYHPTLKGLIIYQSERYFFATGQASPNGGLSGWTVGPTAADSGDGAWRDAEDGQLERVPISWSSAGGIISVRHPGVPANGNATVYHWLAASTRFHRIEELDAIVHKIGPERLIHLTREYWRSWVQKELVDLEQHPKPVAELYKRSLLVMRCHADNRGAIIAGADSDVIQKLRDAYTYVWGRDSAFTAEAFDLAGYRELTRRFYDFLNRTITSEGYLLHKYDPTGSLACHWIPWSDKKGDLILPIQEDSTALVVRSLWEHYTKSKDLEFIRNCYPRLIRSAGSFLARFRDEHTGLPATSWDLWEMRREIHTFTVAAVWAGLQAAANFADLFGETDTGDEFRHAADEIKRAMTIYLVDRESGCFLRSIKVNDDGSLVPDRTPDIANCVPLLFGMFEPNDPRVVSTVRALREALWCNTETGGMARFQNDEWHREGVTDDEIPGNPWIVSTMWLAQCHIAMAQSPDDLKPALDILNWATARALPSGVLPEQMDPHTGAPVNVTPLTWSHAEVVTTVHEYLNKLHDLQG